MRSKADETFVIVETLICPLQISHQKIMWFLHINYLFGDKIIVASPWFLIGEAVPHLPPPDRTFLVSIQGG